jgi:hypothetical protein
MDTLIISVTFTGLFLYILLQIVFFRFIRREQIISWIIYLFLISSGVCIALFYTGFRLYIQPFNGIDNLELFSAVIFFEIMFALSVVIYISCTFGIIESSVRIKLLSLIAEKKNRGILEKEIYSVYNADFIIKKRLERFIFSGNVKKRGLDYYLARRISPIMVPFYILKLMWKMYGIKDAIVQK